MDSHRHVHPDGNAYRHAHSSTHPDTGGDIYTDHSATRPPNHPTYVYACQYADRSSKRLRDHVSYASRFRFPYHVDGIVIRSA